MYVSCLQAHFAKYEPTILELKRKYEAAMKEKMLAGLDRDKMAAKVSEQVFLCCQELHTHRTPPRVACKPEPALDDWLVLCTAVAVGPAQAHSLEERMNQLQEQPQQQQQPQQQLQPQQQSAQVSSSGGGRASPGCFSAGARSGSGPSSALAPWPAACRNAYAECEPPPPAQVNSYTCQKSFKVNAASATAATTAVTRCKSSI